ncbi:MOSC domain-containing protein [Leptolyngbya sp. AN02str]|uniref:MOSC domain-containing protein n=1 Tax=Leptolyngbya sp. AN02str TaxID=3423363 RepID=UPI003D310680
MDSDASLSLSVAGLFIKRAHGQGVEPASELVLKRGLGIEGDAHAIIGSPRQVLMASAPALSMFGLPPGAIQENLLLDSWVETLPSGTVVQVGDRAQIRITFLCEPCSNLNRIQPGLAKDLIGKRGMLGMVVQDGLVRPGDRVVPLPFRLPFIPETTRGKFEEFVARIPSGHVVRTKALLMALGLTQSYARAIPTMLKKSDPSLPVHRIVAADGSLLTQHLPHQAIALQSEGVVFVDGRVSEVYNWNPAEFHSLG